jgi:hypothetical protein
LREGARQVSGEKRQTLCCYHFEVSYFSTASTAHLIHALGENSIGILGMVQSEDMILLGSFCNGFIHDYVAAEVFGAVFSSAIGARTYPAGASIRETHGRFALRLPRTERRQWVEALQENAIWSVIQVTSESTEAWGRRIQVQFVRCLDCICDAKVGCSPDNAWIMS